MQPVSIIVATRNRKDDLRAALHSLQKQTVAHEIIVLDDGSTDSTSDMVAAEFPDVRLFRSEESLGVIRQRNLGAKVARYPVLVSFDDDMELPDPHTVEQALQYFDHPRVGAVAIPHINVRLNRKIYKQAPDEKGICLTNSFIGLGYLVRRDLFIRLNGFRESFFMQTEESDYCIRMLDAGYVVRLTRLEPVHHLLSPVRENARRSVLSLRNQVMFYWHNVPMVILPFGLFKLGLKAISRALRKGKPEPALRGLGAGLRSIFTQFRDRNPVSFTTCGIYWNLRRGRYKLLEDIEHLLPPLSDEG